METGCWPESARVLPRGRRGSGLREKVRAGLPEPRGSVRGGIRISGWVCEMRGMPPFGPRGAGSRAGSDGSGRCLCASWDGLPRVTSVRFGVVLALGRTGGAWGIREDTEAQSRSSFNLCRSWATPTNIRLQLPLSAASPGRGWQGDSVRWGSVFCGRGSRLPGACDPGWD